MYLYPENIRIDHIKNLYQHNGVDVDVLRLDLIHPQVSGNKWFKLKEYLQEASALRKKTILTFGGAYSNHILATAFACKEYGLDSVGIIRGEKPVHLSQTLIDARDLGMDLVFVSRQAYQSKTIPGSILSDSVFIINEGGYGLSGRKGAEAILSFADSSVYTAILTACGTGTTLAGLVNAAHPAQQIMGISVLKNQGSIALEINELLPAEKKNRFSIVHDFHFGGYAKYDQELLDFMNKWYSETGIPSDFVYTGKLFYATDRLIKQGRWKPGSRVLLIHSGGLQGNRSLDPGKLIFQTG